MSDEERTQHLDTLRAMHMHAQDVAQNHPSLLERVHWTGKAAALSAAIDALEASALLDGDYALSDLLQECRQRLAVQRGQLVACQREGASEETFAACRRDIAAAKRRVDALSAAVEDSALLDLMERHGVWAEPLNGKWNQWGLTYRNTWLYADPTLMNAIAQAEKVHPNGWPTARPALRAVAAVLGGQDAPKPCADLTAMQEQSLRELDDFFYGPDDEEPEGKEGA